MFGLKADLPTFSSESPLRLNSWESPTDLLDSTGVLLRATASLKDDGLTGLQNTQAWVEHGVFPLQARAGLLSDHSRPNGPA